MKNLRKFLLCLSVMIAFASPAGAVYKVKEIEKPPVFQNAEEERLYKLRHGEILTDGGILKKGVWGSMVGVIEAPPEVVWKLFIYANDWWKMRFPTMKESRVVTEETAKAVGDHEKVEEAFSVMGDKRADPSGSRLKGQHWIEYIFQYYNLPWPVADRWMILRHDNDETQAAKASYHTQWSKVSGNVRTMSGTLNITSFDGDPNLTLFEYHVESDPGSHVPRFLLKWGVKGTMPQVIKSIRKEAAKVYGSPPPMLKTQ